MPSSISTCRSWPNWDYQSSPSIYRFIWAEIQFYYKFESAVLANSNFLFLGFSGLMISLEKKCGFGKHPSSWSLPNPHFSANENVRQICKIFFFSGGVKLPKPHFFSNEIIRPENPKFVSFFIDLVIHSYLFIGKSMIFNSFWVLLICSFSSK